MMRAVVDNEEWCLGVDELGTRCGREVVATLCMRRQVEAVSVRKLGVEVGLLLLHFVAVLAMFVCDFLNRYIVPAIRLKAWL